MTSDLKSATSRANGAKSNGLKPLKGGKNHRGIHLLMDSLPKRPSSLNAKMKVNSRKCLAIMPLLISPAARPRGLGSRDGRLPLAHRASPPDRNGSDR